MECEYLGTSGFPLGLKAHNRKALLATPAAHAVDSGSTWNGGPTNDQFLDVALQAEEIGWIHCKVKAALPNLTFYVDLEAEFA